ncbi:MAG: Tat pathway signal sequence domain protein [Planctomycetota bacterium]|nr:Tat pathway signal sequence domain protein [Planctomycetota bacterium]
MRLAIISGSILFLAGCMLPSWLLAADAAPVVSVNWLDSSPPPAPCGISWGVPWPRGLVSKNQTFALKDSDGKSLPLQSWPLAYWPDGSIKWTGLATTAGPETRGPLQVTPIPEAPAGGDSLKVNQTADAIEIDTGKLKCLIPRLGPYLIDSMTVDGHSVAQHGQLECILQNGPENDVLSIPTRERYLSNIEKVTLEQSGPVRAVVKIEGQHKAETESRQWLPFVVRLYFFAGEQQVRLVHTIIFDGDQQKDFIRALGLVFDVPMREQIQNRHVRFANSNGGVWAEPLQLALSRNRRGAGLNLGPNQIDGQRLPNLKIPAEDAAWDAFKLVQPNSEGFSIIKRTNPQSSWVGVAEGNRAAGFAFIGDVSGGLGVGVKNFWQSYPASLEIDGALSSTARLHVWLWSPDGPGMDLRHYDIHGHGNVNSGGSYEDYEPAFATPVGVARTSDLMLFPSGATPSRVETAALAQLNSKPPILTVTPTYLHSTGVFGLWSVQDRSTPFKKELEDRLDGLVSYYKNAIDQHHWYGFWNFGDIRHSYDAARHEWRYDIGGFAWDNSELGSVLWLWYSYIRTGNPETYRMAEAMIRHTSEVDTYHLGRFAGLGSRHNVDHWGDSAKEARISQATHGRFYYYLSTDERIGDILTDEAGVDAVASKLDPMRKAQPATEAERKYPGRIRIGPDWLAFAGNWMTAWERTGDTQWRDKIQAGVDSMYAMTYWMRSGKNLVVGYDPATAKLFQLSNQPGSYNLPTIQGGAEVAFELDGLLGNDEFTKMWLQYCRLGSAPGNILIKDKTTGAEGADASLVGESGGPTSSGVPRLAAYAYYKTKNPAYAQRAIRALAARIGESNRRRIEGAEALNPLDESPRVSTNTVAQSSLMDIEILELCADQLPTNPLPPVQGFQRGARSSGADAATTTAPAPSEQ